jgi:hypothetical protein
MQLIKVIVCLFSFITDITDAHYSPLGCECNRATETRWLITWRHIEKISKQLLLFCDYFKPVIKKD